MPGRIEDYAMIGNCRSAALIARDGSIDWLCLPRFDSDACLAALLGEPGHGRWLISPAGDFSSTRSYRSDSLVLETRFDTETGTADVIDFMPMTDPGRRVIRIVRGCRGEVRFRHELVVRFDYGRTIPWVTENEDGLVTAIAGPHLLTLRTQVPLHHENSGSCGEFVVKAGQAVEFVLGYSQSHRSIPPPIDVDEALNVTESFWQDWTSRCRDAGRWSDLVRRSLITLKGLSYRPTGGIVAAATTSLPEKLGGVRNWDYRYCWARDATFTLAALLNSGYEEEARTWRDWVRRAVAGDPAQLQVVYGVAGERQLVEHTLPWLPGYRNSAPVRIGNAAAWQTQLDIYGELVGVLDLASGSNMSFLADLGALQRTFLHHLETIWREPDTGIWEIRAEPQHFVHSKAMAWLAFERAAGAQLPEEFADDQARWARIADEVHAQICRDGVDPERGCFVQSYGCDHVDAALLLLPLIDFLPIDDPRICATIKAVEQRLRVDGLIRRYETERHIDGLPPGEGVFLASNFWLVENYVLMGRMDDAHRLFERLAGLCNDVGLLAEEYDPDDGCMLGNFPQALSHVALVNAAYSLARAESETERAHRLFGRSARERETA